MRRNPISSTALPSRKTQSSFDDSSSKEEVRRGARASLPHDKALQYAYKLLSYRSRSEKELTRRLRMKGFDEPAIQQVIARLKSGGFVDDRRLASSLKRYAEESKHLGISGTRRYLIERGVPAGITDEVVRDVDETEGAKKFVEKKLTSWRKQDFSSGLPHLADKTIKRLYGFLCRRGYSSEAIKKALEQFKIKEDGE